MLIIDLSCDVFAIVSRLLQASAATYTDESATFKIAFRSRQLVFSQTDDLVNTIIEINKWKSGEK
jgi:hypothetical protein